MDRAAGYLWPSPEQTLLLHAALDDGQAAIDAFDGWRRTVRLEDDFSHSTMRLLPLVYHNQHRLGTSDPLMQRLKGVYRHSWYQSNRLFNAVAPVVQRMCDRGVPVLLTKGVPLAIGYYRNMALRPMADVDIVVPQPLVREALGAMVSSGWRAAAWPDDDLLRFRHALQYFGPAGTEVDLHWRPLAERPSGAADDSFFPTAEPLQFMQSNVLQPDPTHALFLNTVHGVRWNVATPVRWIPDAMVILRTRASDIDWDAMHTLATEYRVIERLRLGLAYLRAEFAADVPAAVLDTLASTPRSFRERFETHAELEDDGSLQPSVRRNVRAWFAEYSRGSTARNPLSFAIGYTHYLRFRLGLSGRRELLSRFVQGLGRRMRRDVRSVERRGVA